MKVIRSPIVYEAEQFHSKENIPKYVNIEISNRDSPAYYVLTKDLYYRFLDDGEWIVTDEKGDYETYSEEEFQRIFERVE